MIELITQRIKAKDFGLPGLGAYVEELIKSPSAPYRSEDEVEVILKFHAEEKADVAKLGPGQVRHYITTAALDRDHEIMMPKGLDSKWYRKNPVVLWSHDYTAVDNVIGSNLNLEHTDRGVRAVTQFAMRQPQAVQVFDLFKEGHLRAWSVGFISLAGKEPTAKDLEKLTITLGEKPKPGEVRYIHDKWSLLEYSAVAVPSNMEALTEAVAKGMKLDDELIKQLEITVEKAVDGGKIGDKDTKVVFDLGDSLDGDGTPEEGKEKKTEKDEPEGDAPPAGDGPKGYFYATEPLTDELAEGLGKAFSQITTTDAPGDFYTFAAANNLNYVPWEDTGTVPDWIPKDLDTSGKNVWDWQDGYRIYWPPPTDPDIKDILQEVKALKDEVAAFKEGRILSNKNKSIIKTAVEAMDEATVALRELLASTEPPPAEPVPEPDKSVINIVTETFGDNLDLDKLAKQIASNSVLKDKVKLHLKGGKDNNPDDDGEPGGEE